MNNLGESSEIIQTRVCHIPTSIPQTNSIHAAYPVFNVMNAGAFAKFHSFICTLRFRFTDILYRNYYYFPFFVQKLKKNKIFLD